MADTTTRGFPYPEGTDAVDVAGDIQTLAEAVDTMPGVQSFTGSQIAGLSSGAKWAGRVVWNSTTGRLQVSDGSTFTDVSTTSAILATVVNAKGDLLVGTADDTVARQGVGANDTLLVADSTASTGVKWASLAASQVPTLSSAKVPTVDTSAQTDSYTLVLTDAGKLVEMGKATAQTLTVPPNSSVAFPLGTKIDVVQTGAGEADIAAGSGVTINSQDGNLKLAAQWAGATLVKRATNTWVLIGNLVA